MYTLVSLTKNDALVAGNGSYIVRLSGPDLHGPTMTNVIGTENVFLLLYICFTFTALIEVI